MKKIIMVMLCSVPFYVNAMDKKDPLVTKIQLSSEQTLKAELKNMGLGYFDKKTGLSKELGGKTKVAIRVVDAINEAEYDFEKMCKKMPNNQVIGAPIHMEIPKIFDLLFKDHPEVLEVIKKKGLC